ncbi:PQQ-binding-like beta-propeller repeat protein [Actinoplanes sp. NPDC049599]|uniref:Hsp70 family protein n=1 Tax=Actinoplanes sp. NPDC049599 TaxID=3363903 RepID=UPI0037B6EB9B
MEYGLGVDLGTTFTAAAVRVQDRLEIVQLGSQRPEIPSVVFVKADGEMLIGDAADWRGDAEPDRLVREFKRRMGDPVPIMVAGSPYSAHMLTARLLRHVVDTVTRMREGPPRRITIAHPANWTRFKRDFLSQAAHLAELDDVTFRTEPEAAALQYAAAERLAAGETLAVYDLGGGTFDAAVLRRTATGFELLGEPEGIEHLGGGDFDEAVLDHVTTILGPAFAALDFDDDDVVVGLARLRRDCVRAKENLSADTETTVQVALPGLHQRVRLNRSEFEAGIGPPLEQTVAAMRRALRSAGVAPAELRCILLAGGTSRIPLVGQLLAAAFDRPLVLDAHPEHSVALGAALATGPGPAPGAAPARGAVTAVGTAAVPVVAPVPARPRGRWRESVRAAAGRTWSTLATRHGRLVAGAGGVTAAAVVAALLWWPNADADDSPPPVPSPSPSAPAGPVQLFAAAVQGPVGTAAAIDAERVYVTTGRTVRAVRRADGRPAWPEPFTAPAEITAAPQLAGDTLYVPGSDQRLYALDTADGTRRDRISTGARDPGPPSVAGDAVYFGTSGGSVRKLRAADLREQWRFQTGNAVSQPPAVAAGLVVASSGDGSVYAFDDDTGNRRWSVEVAPSSAPVIAGGRVFVGSDDQHLHALDADSGETAWTFRTGAPVESTPTVDGALVHLGGRDGTVYAVDAATGVERWRFAGAAGEEFGSPVVTAGVSYVAATSGRLYALDAATGRPRWTYDLKGEPAPPRLADGVLYIGTAAEVVYALRVGPAVPGLPSVAPSRSAVAPPSPARLPQPTPRPPTTEPGRPPTSPTKKPTRTSRPPKTTKPTTATTPTTPPTTDVPDPTVTPDGPGDGG